MNAFERCLAKGRLKKIEPDAERVAAELEKAREELSRARQCYAKGRWDDGVTQAYFAMSRCARAAINSQGYRDTNLYGLLAGLEELFVNPEKLPRAVLKQIRDAKDLKDSVYSGHRASIREARRLLLWAQDLARGVFGILALPGFDADRLETGLPEAPEDPQRAAPRPAPAPRRWRDRPPETHWAGDRAVWRPPPRRTRYPQRDSTSRVWND